MTGRQITAFAAAYARAERYYQITDQLGGHQFEIQVKMPGTIIAHNLLEIGDDEIEVYEDENASGVIFNFDGKLFRDQPYELIVVSRLDDGADTGKGSRSDDSGR